jgi:7-cyano-7-deazaguanine synthase
MSAIPMKVLHLLSGGLDSTVLLYDMLKQGCVVHCLLYYYGQRHYRELACARATCKKLDVLYTEVALPKVFARSSLTDGEGDIIVPNRNMAFLSLAVPVALSAGAEAITIGCNADDQQRFPDCRRQFITAMDAAVDEAGYEIEICAPFSEMTKREVVQRGRELHVPLSDTWSCYKGGEKPCGECEACKLRETAFQL